MRADAWSGKEGICPVLRLEYQPSGPLGAVLEVDRALGGIQKSWGVRLVKSTRLWGWVWMMEIFKWGGKQEAKMLDFVVTRVGSVRRLAQGTSWMLCEGWRWLGLKEEPQCSCAYVWLFCNYGAFLTLGAYHTSIVYNPATKPSTSRSQILAQASPLLPCSGRGETPALCGWRTERLDLEGDHLTSFPIAEP